MQIFIFLLGFIGLFFLFRPFAEKLFHIFPDKGWGLIPATSVLLFSALTWWLNHLPFFKLNTALVYTVAMILVLAYVRWGGIKQLVKINQPNSLQIFNLLLWFTIFTSYLLLRQNAPDILGIEKFPDFMIIKSIAVGGVIPPLNTFVSDQVVNYYYFGHYMTAVLSKLTFLPVNWCFHLFMAYCLAATGTALSSITMAIVGAAGFLNLQSEKSKNPILMLSGIMCSLFALVFGNFHTFYHNVILRETKFWYPDATRYIEYTIHEFPFYSILIGDLHGHILNLPNVSFCLALIFLFFKKLSSVDLQVTPLKKLIKDHLALLSLLGLSFGMSYASNSWDIMSTMLLAGLCSWMALGQQQALFSKNTLKAIAALSILFVLGAIISFLPFWIQFEPPSQGVGLVPPLKSSPFLQLLIIWLIHGLIPLIFLASTQFMKDRTAEEKRHIQFIRSLCILGFLLILFLEIFYFKDIYAGHIRANSMFKIGFFIWILFSIASVSIFSISVFGSHYSKFWQSLYLVLFGFLTGAGLTYTIKATYQYVEGQRHLAGSLDGLDFLRKRYPSEYAAIQWIEKNIHGQKNILSAPSESFSEGSKVNIFTGMPAMAGWKVHNWLWHGSLDKQMKPLSSLAKRTGDKDTIDTRVGSTKLMYESNDLDETKRLLDYYRISYVLISKDEKNMYPNLNQDKWNQLGRLVFKTDELKLFEINSGANNE